MADIWVLFNSHLDEDTFKRHKQECRMSLAIQLTQVPKLGSHMNQQQMSMHRNEQRSIVPCLVHSIHSLIAAEFEHNILIYCVPTARERHLRTSIFAITHERRAPMQTQ